ncbi:MAG: AmmeMemoRadiSam system radical SAM enzyme [Candidatus Omnitrophica bacterium]|nr:AmmeMemoRadiSam system radical SAM enzyme [Candidatus Omnitrophota bacterium]
MNTIICDLCPKHCRLRPGDRGNCRVRTNQDGKLQTLVYGNPCAVHVDPIEKKPLFHFLPTSKAFSIATAGCNLHCKYCQNWQISQRPPEETNNYDMPPEIVVEKAIETDCQSIAYTYTDPVIFYEYAFDTSKAAHQKGIRNVLVTAAYIEQKPLKDLCKYTDAANVDLKGITDEFYRKMSDATLQPVLDAILTMIKLGVWVELTNLIVPTWNDQEKDIRQLCRWVYKNAGPDVPMHFSRFWPQHKLKNLPPTPLKVMSRAWEIAKEEGLHFPYVGNVPGHPGNNTYCPHDGKIIIRRRGYMITENHVINGHCTFCKNSIPGVWS